jgi:hypothetical protein
LHLICGNILENLLGGFSTMLNILLSLILAQSIMAAPEPATAQSPLQPPPLNGPKPVDPETAAPTPAPAAPTTQDIDDMAAKLKKLERLKRQSADAETPATTTQASAPAAVTAPVSYEDMERQAGYFGRLILKDPNEFGPTYEDPAPVVVGSGFDVATGGYPTGFDFKLRIPSLLLEGFKSSIFLRKHWINYDIAWFPVKIEAFVDVDKEFILKDLEVTIAEFLSKRTKKEEAAPMKPVIDVKLGTLAYRYFLAKHGQTLGVDLLSVSIFPETEITDVGDCKENCTINLVYHIGGKIGVAGMTQGEAAFAHFKDEKVPVVLTGGIDFALGAQFKKTFILKFIYMPEFVETLRPNYDNFLRYYGHKIGASAEWFFKNSKCSDGTTECNHNRAPGNTWLVNMQFLDQYGKTMTRDKAGVHDSTSNGFLWSTNMEIRFSGL